VHPPSGHRRLGGGAVGLASPGISRHPNGKLIEIVIFTGWTDFRSATGVAAHCGLPVTFVNDANAAAYGEFWAGAGRDFPQHGAADARHWESAAASLSANLTIAGENSLGGECGHIIIDHSDNARMCGLRTPRALGSLCQRHGVIKRTRELLDAGRSSSLNKRLADGAELTPTGAEEAGSGDALSLEIVGRNGPPAVRRALPASCTPSTRPRAAGRGNDVRRQRDSVGSTVLGTGFGKRSSGGRSACWPKRR